jgi:hypothetical protein
MKERKRDRERERVYVSSSLAVTLVLAIILLSSSPTLISRKLFHEFRQLGALHKQGTLNSSGFRIKQVIIATNQPTNKNAFFFFFFFKYNPALKNYKFGITVRSHERGGRVSVTLAISTILLSSSPTLMILANNGVWCVS